MVNRIVVEILVLIHKALGPWISASRVNPSALYFIAFKSLEAGIKNIVSCLWRLEDMLAPGFPKPSEK